jgi:hypothetical protein
MTPALILNPTVVPGMLASTIPTHRNDRHVTDVVRLSRWLWRAAARARLVGTAVKDRA